MPSDSKFTRDDDGNVAVRVVSNTGVSEQPESMFTTDEDGNVAVRVVFGEGGGGGGDSHNKGFYATPTALNEAVPTAEAGDYAIVGSTDTVWIWDTDTSAWVDSDQKGQVTSVNNQTGDVTVQATLVSGTNIKSVNGESLLGSGNLEVSGFLPYPSGWTTNSTTKAFCDAVAADSSATVGKAYLGEVTFSDLPASMVNAEVNVYINSGATAANKVVVLELSSGNTAPYKWMYVYWNGGTNVSGWKTWQETLVSGTNIKTINGNSLLGAGDISVGLPSQTGNSGKFLTTDGTDASWSDKPLVNKSTSNGYVISTPITGGTSLTANNVVFIGNVGLPTKNAGNNSIGIGVNASLETDSVAIGGNSFLKAQTGSIAIGNQATVWSKTYGNRNIAIGSGATIGNTTDNVNYAIQLGTGTNLESGTFCIGSYYNNAMVNYKLLDADGTIPEARLADTTSAQQGDVLTLDSNGNAVWQAGGSGGGLPSQTGHSGEMLTTDGTDASWGTTIKPITITPSSLYYTGVVTLKGYNNNNDILQMNMTPSTGQLEIDVRNNTGTRTGWYYFDSAFYPHQTMSNLTLGKSTNKWDNVFTTKINNGADITVPAVAGEMVVKQVNTTITLTSAGWSSNTQTVNVTGMTATGVVMVSPDPTDQSAYTSAGIYCTAQAAGTLTFTCDTVPSGDIDVNVVML